MNGTKIVRRTVTHSYEEYADVVKVIENPGYRIVRTIPNELGAGGRESDALVTIADREESDTRDECDLDATTCEYYGDGCGCCDGIRRMM